MMIIDDVYNTTVGAPELAVRAPSIHNSQPWRCWLTERTLHLFAAADRWLPATDADHRDLLLSCGAMLHHLVVALRAAGVRPTVHRIPNPAVEDHLAALELRAEPTSNADIGLARPVAARRSDRRPFTSWEVPEAFLAELVEQAAERGAVLRAIKDDGDRQTVLDAIREAEAIQRTTPGYQHELATWTGRSLSDDGVPVASLLQETATRADAARDFPTGDLSAISREPDGAVLLVLGTASDDRMSQLRAGEAMSAVLLRATQAGLATCPLSQPLEVPSTRRLLEEQVLGGALTPQLILRVGFAPSGPPRSTGSRHVRATARLIGDRHAEPLRGPTKGWS